MDATFLFARHLTHLRYGDLPARVVEETKKQVLDLLGVALGGFSKPGPRELRDLVLGWGGREESTIIGTTQKVPSPNAGHVNATMVHALDYDDVHERAVMHSGVTIIPTCLAVAEQKGRLDGREFITAVAAGVDMMCRFALATTPGKSPIDTGWHLTTVFGFMGAAGVASRMLGLDEGQTINAFGIAYHQCSGNGQCVKDGALTKRLGPGFSVKGGMTAALLAEKGVTGAHECLEGEWGLYRQYMRGDYDPKALTADLGKRFEGIDVAIKPYPCCRGIHPAIDAALAIMTEHALSAEDVQEVKLFASEAHYTLLCTPETAKFKPRSPVDAQFSIPWGTAAAIARKRATLEEFTPEAIESRDIRAIIEKTRVEKDKGLKRSGMVEPTRVEIKTLQGATYSMTIEHPLGSMERPMSFDDCARKFRDCARRIGSARSDRVIDLVSRLERLDDIGEIVRQLIIGE
jgi:2-methylcitrate dehydratase PrpD